jgi:hypothetical protein
VGCKDFGVTQVLVGLHRVGVVGLRQAIQDVDSSSLTEREVVVQRLLDLLRPDNYIPGRQLEDFKVALWREYLRFKGEDFSKFFSPIDVDVFGTPGPELDSWKAQLTSVFSDFELTPVFNAHLSQEYGPSPQLRIAGQLVVSGQKSREKLKTAIRLSFSDW